MYVQPKDGLAAVNVFAGETRWKSAKRHHTHDDTVLTPSLLLQEMITPGVTSACAVIEGPGGGGGIDGDEDDDLTLLLWCAVPNIQIVTRTDRQ
ncbi:hypothetical protein QTP88_004756 [Uroleucon formosanum]